jgi:hypothetical protein
MPTKREREYYAMGFRDGRKFEEMGYEATGRMSISRSELGPRAKPKRKLSAWQKYIKNKRNHIKYRDGKLNLKKMGIAFRRKQRR